MSTEKRAVQRRVWRRRNKGRSENYQASRKEEYSHIGRNKSNNMGKHKQQNQVLGREETKMVHITNKIPKEEDMSFTTSNSTPKAKTMKSMTRGESRNQTKRKNDIDELSYSKSPENRITKYYELPHSIEFLSLLLPENFSSHKSSDEGSTSSSSTNSMYSFSSDATIMAKERVAETIKIVTNIERYFICSPLSPEPLAEPSNNDMHMNVDFLLESKEEELADLANRCIRSKQYDDAILIYESVLEIYSKNQTYHPLVTKSLHNLGIVHVLKGNYKDALKCCNKALKFRRKNSPTDHIGAASSLSELGIIHFALENFNKSLETFREALNIYSKQIRCIHRSSRMAIILNNIACIHFSTGKLDASIATFDECLNLMKRNIGTVNSLKVPRMMFNTSIVLSNTAIAFAKQYDSDQAVTIMEEALLIQQSILPDTHSVIIATSQLLYGSKNEVFYPSKSSKVFMGKKNKVKGYQNSKHFPQTPKKEIDILEILPLGELTLECNTIKSIHHHLSIQNLPNLLRKEANSKRHYRWVDVRKDKANDFEFSSILQKAIVYTEKRKIQKAIKYLSKVMEGRETKCGDVPHILSSIHYVIGLLFLQSSQYTEALKHFTKSLKIRSSLLEKDHNDVRVSLGHMIELYHHYILLTSKSLYIVVSTDVFSGISDNDCNSFDGY